MVHKSTTHLNARVAQLVEHNLAKVGVAGSNPVSRSTNDEKVLNEYANWDTARTQ